jgi:hypothetical protein
LTKLFSTYLPTYKVVMDSFSATQPGAKSGWTE